MRLIGYIHKKDFREIIPQKQDDSRGRAAWFIKNRGFMVWDKKWGDGNDIEVIIEINEKNKSNKRI